MDDRSLPRVELIVSISRAAAATVASAASAAVREFRRVPHLATVKAGSLIYVRIVAGAHGNELPGKQFRPVVGQKF